MNSIFKTINKILLGKTFLSLSILFFLAVPWSQRYYDSFVVVTFPELKIRCVYGSCRLKHMEGRYGDRKCIVQDSNKARVVVDGLTIPCDEFIGKTVIWRDGENRLTGTILRAQRTY